MASFHRILVILNPTAGQRRIEKIRSTVEESLTEAGIEFTIETVEGTGDTMRWARAAHAEGYDLVAVAGGDGTLREAVDGLMRGGAQIPLAQLPTGTVNLVARAMSIPADLKKALRVVTEGKVVKLDVGYLPQRDRYFAFVAGCGYDGRLIHDTPRELKKKIGFFAYVATGLKHFFTVRPVHIELEMDDEIKRIRAHTVMAVNIGSIANLNWSFGPDINPHDGRLNIAVMSTRSLWGSLLVLLKIITKRYHGYAYLKHFQARRIRVTADPPLPFQVDGDALGSTPFLAVVIPKGMQFVVPIDYSF